jgi:hypothetical protein
MASTSRAVVLGAGAVLLGAVGLAGCGDDNPVGQDAGDAGDEADVVASDGASTDGDSAIDAPATPASVLVVFTTLTDGGPEYASWRDGVTTAIACPQAVQPYVFAALIDAKGDSVLGGSCGSNPAYWVNGQAQLLDTANTFGGVRALAQDPVTGKLLFGGVAASGNASVYWTEGSSTPTVVDSGTSCQLRGLDVDPSGTVFASGFCPGPNYNVYNAYQAMAYELGGTPQAAFVASYGTTSYYGSAVHVNAAGKVWLLVADAGVWTWAPGVALTTANATSGGLSFPNGYQQFLSAMAVSSSDHVYVSATRQNTQNTSDIQVGYFVDGAWNALQGTQATGVGVDAAGHAYVSGQALDGTTPSAGYWNDGVWTTVAGGSGDTSEALAIAVR